MPVNPAALTDVEVREVLVQMDQVITTQAQAITAQASREGAPSENPHASTMSSKLRDFTRMNPLVYNGFKTNGDTHEFVDEVYKILCAMGVNERRRMTWLHINSKMWHRCGTKCG